jgi:hypothetical protein
MKYAIYQLKESTERLLKFAPFVTEVKVHPENYDKVFEGELSSLNISENNEPDDILEFLYNIFNAAHPEGFQGHSLSVSDVVCLQDGVFQEFYYVDSVGYKKLESFGDKIVTDIKWDTDGHYVKGLPRTVNIDPEVEDDDIADILSDEYGYCIFGLAINRRVRNQGEVAYE